MSGIAALGKHQMMKKEKPNERKPNAMNTQYLFLQSENSEHNDATNTHWYIYILPQIDEAS